MGGRTTETGGSASQGKSALRVNYVMMVERCLQTGSEQQMHKGEQTMRKTPGGPRVTGQDLALGDRARKVKIKQVACFM